MKCSVHVLPGNYPLHLAAWSGNADVAKVLINTGPSRANVNEQASYIVHHASFQGLSFKAISKSKNMGFFFLRAKGLIAVFFIDN